MKNEFALHGREKILGQLMAGFRREETLNLERLSTLEEQLSPQELEICGDSLAVMRVRALFESAKFVQSYHALANALRRFPMSLSLQFERGRFLAACQSALSDQMHADPLNPMIEAFYEILKKEGFLHAGHHGEFLKLLISQQRFVEAARLAVPLVVLYPAQLGLREQVEAIASQVPHPDLSAYLLAPRLRIGRRLTTSVLSAKQTRVLVEKMTALWSALRSEKPVHIIERQIKEVIGEEREDQPLDTQLKEFYYLQAVLEEKKENYFAALVLFRSLVEMDTCNLNFRRSLETEMAHVCEDFMSKANHGEKSTELVNAYPVLIEIGHVRFELLTQVCLAEVRGGRPAQAKEKMRHLVSLNPLDSDYVEAALQVADLSQDETWTAELLRCLDRIREERPWDLELRMENEPEKAVA